MECDTDNKGYSGGYMNDAFSNINFFGGFMKDSGYS